MDAMGRYNSDENESDQDTEPIRLDSFITIGDKNDIKPRFENTFIEQPKTEKYMKDIIIEKSKSLQKAEHLEIFKILERNDENYTQNSNGIFVALNNVKPQTLNEIYNFIEFRSDNSKVLSERLDQSNHIFNTFLNSEPEAIVT